MFCQCHCRNSSGLFTSLHLHYHHLTGTSYLDPYGNFLSGLVACSVFCFPFNLFPSHSGLSFCVTTYLKPFNAFLLCSGRRLNSTWLHGGSQGPLWSHPAAISFLLSILHFTFSSPVSWKWFLRSLVLCTYCIFLNAENDFETLIISLFEGETIVFHTPLPQSSEIPLLYIS